MKTFAIVASMFLTAYVVFRLIGGAAFHRRVTQDLEDVLHKDEFKVKGRFE